MSVIELFWPAFVLVVFLVFIHSIFGLEIIRRGVIFTDLAIGQIAAIGMAVSITYLDGQWQTPMVLGFAVLAALLISYASKKVEHVEAFIGLLYALGISFLMLLLAQSSEGTELFKQISAADILFTSPEDLIESGLIYFSVSLVMFFVYPKVEGIVKELLFFSMLAIVVSSSVQNSGVLVVFSLLIAPAYLALVQQKVKPLWFAWMMGSFSALFAMMLSYFYDLPTGYTIIFVLVFITLVGVWVLSPKKKI
jgi:zinc/manganese transport system permease protein